MLLAIDIGNTSTAFGVFEERRLCATWSIATEQRRSADEIGVLLHELFRHEGLDHRSVHAVIVSSVVPALADTTRHLARRYFEKDPIFVGPGMRTGLPIRVDNPKEVGADRIVNAVAAFDLVHGPCIVVDLGTATTFDVVTSDGAYVGGVIAPGWQISADALFQRASKLPRVELSEPTSVIGRNTVMSMQSGLFHGYIAMVDGLCRRIREEMDSDSTTILATGGLSERLIGVSEEISRHEPNLTLHGLRLLWERQK